MGFLSYWSWNICRIIIQKNQCHEYHKFHDFLLCERIAGSKSVIKFWKERHNVGLPFLNHKKTPQILWPLSFTHSAESNIVKYLWYSWHYFFQSWCSRLELPAWYHDTKIAVRPFDTIYDILRSLSFMQSLLKGQDKQIWCQRKSPDLSLLRTDGLIIYW